MGDELQDLEDLRAEVTRLAHAVEVLAEEVRRLGAIGGVSHESVAAARELAASVSRRLEDRR